LGGSGPRKVSQRTFLQENVLAEIETNRLPRHAIQVSCD